MASKKKAKPTRSQVIKQNKENKEFDIVSNRITGAQKQHSEIRAYAFGKDRETMDMPVDMGTRSKTFTTDYSEPDAADDAARVPLSQILKQKQTGTDTSAPEAIVSQAWGVPPVPESTREGVLNTYQTSRKKPASKPEVATTVGKRLEEVRQAPGLDFSPKGTTSTTFDEMVQHRTKHFEAGSEGSTWYLGERTGVVDGVPQYSEGNSPRVIRETAEKYGLDVPMLRRGTALVSPRSKWNETKGGETRYPNVEVAAKAMSQARDTNTPSQAIAHSVAMAGSQWAGSALPENLMKAVQTQRGVASPPTGRIAPPKNELVPSQKVPNFDLGLTSAHHPEHGYSPWVAGQQSKAWTSDTHDASVAGIKQGGKKFADTFLGNPGGYDLSVHSAQVATAEAFQRDASRVHQIHGPDVAEKWKRENAHKYTPNVGQSTTWQTARGSE
jgi:hypothetical protein